jgi:hypothetical protein
VKLTDFGIARMNTSNLTHEGQLLGTPNYMAPEQILGKELDHRADVFSLGVVFYEMLTRRKPFQGENLTVVTHRIVYDAFTPPEQHVEGMTPALKTVLHRALEKDPARRYQHAGEMADELKRIVPPSGDDTSATQDVAEFVPAGAAASARGVEAVARRHWVAGFRECAALDPSSAGALGRDGDGRLALLLVVTLGVMFAREPGAETAAAAQAPPGVRQRRARPRSGALRRTLEAGASGARSGRLRAGDPAAHRRAGVGERPERSACGPGCRAAALGQAGRARRADRGRSLLGAHGDGPEALRGCPNLGAAVLAISPDEAEAKSVVTDAEAAIARRRSTATKPVTPALPLPIATPATPAGGESTVSAGRPARRPRPMRCWWSISTATHPKAC